MGRVYGARRMAAVGLMLVAGVGAAQAVNRVPTNAVGPTRGVCEILNVNRSSQADIHVWVDANAYFNTHKARIDRETAVIRVIQQPKHGTLEPHPDWTRARYLPNGGYVGKDFLILEVAGNGHTVRVQYFLLVTDDDGVRQNPACKTRDYWKISLPTMPAGRVERCQWGERRITGS